MMTPPVRHARPIFDSVDKASISSRRLGVCAQAGPWSGRIPTAAGPPVILRRQGGSIDATNPYLTLSSPLPVSQGDFGTLILG